MTTLNQASIPSTPNLLKFHCALRSYGEKRYREIVNVQQVSYKYTNEFVGMHHQSASISAHATCPLSCDTLAVYSHAKITIVHHSNNEFFNGSTIDCSQQITEIHKIKNLLLCKCASHLLEIYNIDTKQQCFSIHVDEVYFILVLDNEHVFIESRTKFTLYRLNTENGLTRVSYMNKNPQLFLTSTDVLRDGTIITIDFSEITMYNALHKTIKSIKVTNSRFSGAFAVLSDKIVVCTTTRPNPGVEFYNIETGINEAFVAVPISFMSHMDLIAEDIFLFVNSYGHPGVYRCSRTQCDHIHAISPVSSFMRFGTTKFASVSVDKTLTIYTLPYVPTSSQLGNQIGHCRFYYDVELVTRNKNPQR